MEAVMDNVDVSDREKAKQIRELVVLCSAILQIFYLGAHGSLVVKARR
jgi:hypothetical protein